MSQHVVPISCALQNFGSHWGLGQSSVQRVFWIVSHRNFCFAKKLLPFLFIRKCFIIVVIIFFFSSKLPTDTLNVKGAAIQVLVLNQDYSFSAESILLLNQVQNMSGIASLEFLPVYLMPLRKFDMSHISYQVSLYGIASTFFSLNFPILKTRENITKKTWFCLLTCNGFSFVIVFVKLLSVCVWGGR